MNAEDEKDYHVIRDAVAAAVCLYRDAIDKGSEEANAYGVACAYLEIKLGITTRAATAVMRIELNNRKALVDH